MNNPRNVLVLALLAALAGGCAAKNNGGWSPIDDGSPAGTAALHSGSGGHGSGHSLADSPAVDLARLRRIYDERTEAASGYDYPIGTGDMIEISVPGMPELDDETVRVASSGTVSLPMIGDINAAGLTEKQFKSELRKALAQYMHRPHVAVHVTEYRSRQVGVLGAVTEPGLHTVKNAQATILDMISEAGGLTDEATQRLLFIPVDRLDPQEAESLELVGLVSSNAQRSQLGADPQEPLLQASDPIVIDLDKMNSRSQRVPIAGVGSQGFWCQRSDLAPPLPPIAAPPPPLRTGETLTSPPPAPASAASAGGSWTLRVGGAVPDEDALEAAWWRRAIAAAASCSPIGANTPAAPAPSAGPSGALGCTFRMRPSARKRPRVVVRPTTRQPNNPESVLARVN